MKYILRWISKMTWMNMVVWYLLCTVFSMIALSMGILHHVGPVWFTFTGMVIVKIVMDHLDSRLNNIK